MFDALPALHAAHLRRLITVLEGDGRFRALLGGGSLIDGGFDAQSDLDLVLVVEDAAHGEVMAQRRGFAEGCGRLLAAFGGEHVGEPRLLICLYGPELLHVDLKFVRADELDRLVERPRLLWARAPEAITAVLERATVAWPNRPAQWFEDRAWIWLHYAATKLHRGELFEAMGMIAFFREQILGPLLHRRAGRPQRGVRRIETDAAAAERLSRVVAAHDAVSIEAALARAADLYLDLRDDDPPETPTPEMPDGFRRFLAGAATR
jgi:hypothetical protein